MKTLSDAAKIANQDISKATNSSQHPKRERMIVSITRHRRSIDDVTFTYQFPLSMLQDAVATECAPTYFHALKEQMEDEMHLYSEAESVVLIWCMAEAGQVALVRDDYSFDAAVLDHQNAGKMVVQLFVVKTAAITDLPRLCYPDN